MCAHTHIEVVYDQEKIGSFVDNLSLQFYKSASAHTPLLDLIGVANPVIVLIPFARFF